MIPSKPRTFVMTAVMLAVMLAAGPGRAQEKPAALAPPAPQAKPRIPLQVTVVIARYTGEKADKRVSTLPFAMRVNTNDRPTSVRMATDVPVPQGAFGPGGVVSSYERRSVGTNIDCSAENLEGGRYALRLTISDSQIQLPPNSPAGTPVGVQSFSVDMMLVIRDGETIQHTSATDKSTGETVKIDVTLNAVK
jgi:outer membrane receptor protein involved in Fe transport